MKNILLIDSSEDKHYFFIKLINELVKYDFSFSLLSKKNFLYRKFRENNWPAKLNSFGWPKNNIASIFFLSFLRFPYLISLMYRKYSNNLEIVICLNWREKVVLTPIVKFLKLRMIWFEQSNFRYSNLSNYWNKKINKYSVDAEKICFSNIIKQELITNGMDKENWNTVFLGINISDYVYQDDIFNSLAEANPTKFHEHYFTVGTVIDGEGEQRVEMILKSLQKCIEFIPAIQFIIIGENKGRKRISWLVKRMKLENYVWIISDEVNLKKWFNNFDLFVVAERYPSLNNFITLLGAMANKLSVIGQKESLMEEAVVDNQSGILMNIDSQSLADKVIELQQNELLRKELGKMAKNTVEECYTFDKTVQKMIQILNTTR